MEQQARRHPPTPESSGERPTRSAKKTKIGVLIVGVVGFLVAISVPMNTSYENRSDSLCPSMRLAGMPCPGCGMARGVSLASQGDLIASVMMNPFALAFMLGYMAISALAAIDLIKGSGRYESFWNWVNKNGTLLFWLLLPIILLNWIWNVDKFVA